MTHLDRDEPNRLTPESDEQTTTPMKRGQKRTAEALLRRVVDRLGIDVVASALGLTAPDLERVLTDEKPMSLSQQHTLAMAVLVLSEAHPDLRRRAMGLLSQVRAAAEFEAGVTERHMSPPVSSRWWR